MVNNELCQNNGNVLKQSNAPSESMTHSFY